jgi:Eukaryotic cytochrome b561
LLAAFVIVEVNKTESKRAHFESPHSILGLITYILILLQVAGGVTQFFYPQLYGSVEKAKKVYKYHRMSGYVIIGLFGATVSAATWTEYNLTVLKIHHWSVITATVILLASLYARIKKQKLGL